MEIISRCAAVLGTLVISIAGSVLSQQMVDENGVWRDQQERQRKKQEEYRKLYDSLPKLEITGRVVDQYGDPVADAKVTIIWENADELLEKMPKRREEIVKTDSQGWFKLRCDKPVEAKAEAEKEGYARLSGTARNLIIVRHQMPEAVPAVITLRKRGEPTFLLRKLRTGAHWVRMCTNAAEQVASDLLVSVKDGNKLLVQKKDLCVKISYDVARKFWLIDYMVAQGDGIICSDECLYEAPLSGYTNRVCFSLSNEAGKVVKYLYLRNRSPTIYSRVEVGHIISRDPNSGPVLRLFRHSCPR